MTLRSRGFTVIEAVVSLALVALFLLLTSQLFREVQLSSLAGQRQTLDPLPQLAAHMMRNDIHRARRVVRLPGSSRIGAWVSDSLTLQLPDGGTVRYESSEGAVLRSVFDPAGEPVGSRTLIQGTVSWRWQQITSTLLELEITYHRRPDGDHLRRTWRDAGMSTDTLRLRLAMRAVPGRRSW